MAKNHSGPRRRAVGITDDHTVEVANRLSRFFNHEFRVFEMKFLFRWQIRIEYRR